AAFVDVRAAGEAMTMALALARVFEQFGKPLLAVAVTPARDVGPVDQHQHHLVFRILAIGSEHAAELVGDALGHGRLADADGTVEQEALHGAVNNVFAPLVPDQPRRLAEDAAVIVADDLARDAA